MRPFGIFQLQNIPFSNHNCFAFFKMAKVFLFLLSSSTSCPLFQNSALLYLMTNCSYCLLGLRPLQTVLQWQRPEAFLRFRATFCLQISVLLLVPLQLSSQSVTCLYIWWAGDWETDKQLKRGREDTVMLKALRQHKIMNKEESREKGRSSSATPHAPPTPRLAQWPWQKEGLCLLKMHMVSCMPQ